jgi:hypothetical protein
VAKILIDHGSDPKFKNYSKKSAIDIGDRVGTGLSAQMKRWQQEYGTTLLEENVGLIFLSKFL